MKIMTFEIAEAGEVKDAEFAENFSFCLCVLILSGLCDLKRQSTPASWQGRVEAL
jgi:hypothetical protein